MSNSKKMKILSRLKHNLFKSKAKKLLSIKKLINEILKLKKYFNKYKIFNCFCIFLKIK